MRLKSRTRSITIQHFSFLANAEGARGAMPATKRALFQRKYRQNKFAALGARSSAIHLYALSLAGDLIKAAFYRTL